MATLLGTTLNARYRLDERIGTGGMSTVYRAFDMTLERTVAIKLLHRELAAPGGEVDHDQLERFRREARAVAQLSHPHIVTVIDAGEDAGHPYIVFEHVEGETLKARIQRLERLPVPEAIAYAIEIARALGYAHSRNIVHRDVKPQNVLIDPEGSAKVTDFGIARSLDEEGLTADGRVLGTTDYCSPEQAMGHEVTGQSDLYSLGIVLYEMLAGEVPFQGENQVAVAMKHVRDALPDIQTRRPGISAALAAVLDRATAKQLDRRYHDADEMIADLEEVLAIETARTGAATGEATAVLRTISPQARRRLPLRFRYRTAMAVAALLAVGGAIVAVIVLGEHAQRGTGSAGAGHPKGLTPISLASGSAHDYDPFGTPDQREHPELTSFVVDRQPDTSWQTEHYRGGLSKSGVGIYVDASPGVAARALKLLTPTPGFFARVYAAKNGPPQDFSGWGNPLAGGAVSKHSQRFDLDTAGNRFRYYLVWITRLPPSGMAKIAEIYLYR